MKLPNPERAVVDVVKLRDYCLSASHSRGRHKARVFAAPLGLTAEDADRLREALLAAARNEEARPTEGDDYGQRYVLDFDMTTPTGSGYDSLWLDRPARRGLGTVDDMLRADLMRLESRE